MNELNTILEEAYAVADMAFQMNDASGAVSALLSIDAAEYLMDEN